MSAPTLVAPETIRAALVIHPERRDRFPEVRDACVFVRGSANIELETRGDGRDADRVRELVTSTDANVVIAAGGDGTVATVARGLLALPRERRPDIAILPLGTANNVARSFGLPSVRLHGPAAIRRTLASLRSLEHGIVDVGEANGVPFLGSFALGMDAAILRRRNRLRARSRLGETLGGYPLYLASCAIETLGHQSVPTRITADDVRLEAPIYNLLVTRCPIYAGEFRFTGRGGVPAGRLSLHAFHHRRDFLVGYASAWRRHVRHVRDELTEDAPTTRLCRNAHIRLSSPAAAQLDGEEAAASDEWRIEVIPDALRLRLPPQV